MLNIGVCCHICGNLRDHYGRMINPGGNAMPHIARLRMVSAAMATGALLAGGLATATAAHAASRRSAIADTHPAWAVMSARFNGPGAARGAMTARVYLAGRDRAGLAAYATAVSTPGSALYRHYLTPAQLVTRFGATS